MWSLGCVGDPSVEETRRYLGTLVILGQPVPVHLAAVPAASFPFRPLFSQSNSEPQKSMDDFCSGHNLTIMIAHLRSGVTYSKISSPPPFPLARPSGQFSFCGKYLSRIWGVGGPGAPGE